VFYFPCVSTFAALVREVGGRWAWLAAGLSLGLATGLAMAVRYLAGIVM
jgi:Fe2+ transport system protein B